MHLLENPLVCTRHSWVEVDGTLYKKPCTLVVRMEDGVPIFGKLQEIYEVDSKYFYHLKVYDTQDFNHHFHSFIIRQSSTTIIIDRKELYSFLPHQVRAIPHNLGICTCVVPHYHFASC